MNIQDMRPKTRKFLFEWLSVDNFPDAIRRLHYEFLGERLQDSDLTPEEFAKCFAQDGLDAYNQGMGDTKPKRRELYLFAMRAARARVAEATKKGE